MTTSRTQVHSLQVATELHQFIEQEVLPGTGVASIMETVELTKHAVANGVEAVVMLPPYYYKAPSDDGLFAFFSEVVQRIGSGLPIYLYNFPQQTAIPFTFALIARLLKAYPGVIRGAKDSSGNFENTGGMAKEFGKDGFEVYAGDDALLRDLFPVLEEIIRIALKLKPDYAIAHFNLALMMLEHRPPAVAAQAAPRIGQFHRLHGVGYQLRKVGPPNVVELSRKLLPIYS